MPLAEQILAGQAHWLDQRPLERWIGGVRIDPIDWLWMVSEQGEVWRRG